MTKAERQVHAHGWHTATRCGDPVGAGLAFSPVALAEPMAGHVPRDFLAVSTRA